MSDITFTKTTGVSMTGPFFPEPPTHSIPRCMHQNPGAAIPVDCNMNGTAPTPTIVQCTGAELLVGSLLSIEPERGESGR